MESVGWNERHHHNLVGPVKQFAQHLFDFRLHDGQGRLVVQFKLMDHLFALPWSVKGMFWV